MNWLQKFVDIVIHLDSYLTVIIQQYGGWTYGLLFLVIFAETGLVITPFLPGDSLLFAAGTFAALGSLNVFLLAFLLSLAAILGDTINYHIGKYIGPKVFHERRRFLKKEYLDRAEAFYEKHGGKAIVFARFIPIIRTFAPFVAGVGKMNYRKFLLFNITGGVGWVCIFVFGGYLFGNLDFVKENFTLVIVIIMLTSFVPPLWEFVRQKIKK